MASCLQAWGQSRDNSFKIRADGLTFAEFAQFSSGAAAPTHAGLKGDRFYRTDVVSTYRLDADGSSWILDTVGVTAHSALTGLAADDHTQYVLHDSATQFINGSLNIGSSGSPSFPLDVVNTSTATSGAITGARVSTTLNPTSNSTATVNALDVVVLSSASAFDKGTTVQGSRYLVHRSATDSGNIPTIRGIFLQSLNNAALSTGQGSVTTNEAAAFQAFDNSSTTTATTTLRGGNFLTGIGGSNVASRVYTSVEAARFSNSLGASSTSTTVTNFRLLNVDQADTGTLNRTGTITNGIGIDMTGWTTAGVFGSGLTFTNPPEYIRLQSSSVANNIAIRQMGTVSHSRFNGSVSFGQDIAPTAYIHAAAGTASANTSPLKLTAGTDLTTVEAGAMEYDGTRFKVSSLGTATRQELTTTMLKDVTIATTNTTTTETTHYTTTIPGGTLNTKNGLRLTIIGDIRNAKGTNGTVTLRLKYGGTTVCSMVQLLASSANNRGLKSEFLIQARNSATSQDISCETIFGQTLTTAGAGSTGGNAQFAHFHGLAISSGSDQTLAYTIQMDASDANFEVQTDSVILEYL